MGFPSCCRRRGRHLFCWTHKKKLSHRSRIAWSAGSEEASKIIFFLYEYFLWTLSSVWLYQFIYDISEAEKLIFIKLDMNMMPLEATHSSSIINTQQAYELQGTSDTSKQDTQLCVVTHPS